MNSMLEKKYEELMGIYGFVMLDKIQNVNLIIKNCIREFVRRSNVPAVWCYGKHTKMLMTDFIFEMKGIKYIIDREDVSENESGFRVIKESNMEEAQIDGVIISTYLYREEIKETLKKNHKPVKYLDIYEELEKQGIVLDSEYYAQLHPYGHYTRINSIRDRIRSTRDKKEKADLYNKLLEEFLCIKDFLSAIECLDEYIKIEDTDKNKSLIGKVKDLYRLQKKYAERISSENVLMICIDGVRRSDVDEGLMPKMSSYLAQNSLYFKNAYSVSTSTYESLIPAYSENNDLSTGYFESNFIQEEKCRFIQEAIKQNRSIYFYTDSMQYVKSSQIKVTDNTQTATEKMWDFILDAADESNGLFYIHILYESHFSYPNPYTDRKLVADGTSILFDYLQKNGAGLRTDYLRQHRDALRYLDDVLAPFWKRLRCRMVLFADHGNLLLQEGTQLNEIENTAFSFHNSLIQVPLFVKSPETGRGVTDTLCSLMDLNTIIISLLKKRKVVMKQKEYIKVVRSEIYNPDFKHLYHKADHDKELQAFEAFVFAGGYKAVIYANGQTELYLLENDERLNNELLLNQLIAVIKDDITVTGVTAIP